MKKFLLPENAKYYKAGLHTHTVLSDGKKTPEQVKKDYIAHGYSIIAYTDHDKFISHQDLTDDSFVALNGFELEYYTKPWFGKTCHLCFIAKDPNNSAYGWSDPNAVVFYHELPEGALNPISGGMLYQVTCPGRKYNPTYINEDIRKAKEMGFFVTYNHPTWSLESFEDYKNYKGMDAMEISNYTSVVEGYNEDNSTAYRDLLNLGNNISCIATDDNHNNVPDNDPKSDSYGGYVCLALEKLNYESVIKALENRQFYSCSKVNPSSGECPEIKNLWTEDGFVHIEFSPSSRVCLIKDSRRFSSKIAGEGKTITSADFEIGPCSWFRLEVTGLNGCKAYTNATFL